MIVVDTSIWIDHIRRGDATLERLLNAGQVLSHPFVAGELLLGNLRDRQFVNAMYRMLPAAVRANDDDVLAFIDRFSLNGSGIGYVDAHLLAATRLTAGAALWTRDKRLATVAGRLQVMADIKEGRRLR